MLDPDPVWAGFVMEDLRIRIDEGGLATQMRKIHPGDKRQIAYLCPTQANYHNA
jgi:hypothetical protein